MVANSGPWSVGYLWALGIGIPFIIVSLVLTVLLLKWARSANVYDEFGYYMGAGFSFFLAIAVAIGLAIGLYPYDAQYHQYREVTGTVVNINSRLVPSGEAVTQRFALDFGDQTYYGCDDTRCAVIKIGDKVTLRCIRDHQSNSTDGYKCNFIRNYGKGS